MKDSHKIAEEIFSLPEWKDIIDFLSVKFESKLGSNFVCEVYSLLNNKEKENE